MKIIVTSIPLPIVLLVTLYSYSYSSLTNSDNPIVCEIHTCSPGSSFQHYSYLTNTAAGAIPILCLPAELLTNVATQAILKWLTPQIKLLANILPNTRVNLDKIDNERERCISRLPMSVLGQASPNTGVVQVNRK